MTAGRDMPPAADARRRPGATDGAGLLRAAGEALYRWPSRFPGYTASVSVALDGQVVENGGHLRVHPAGGALYHPRSPELLAEDVIRDVVGFASMAPPHLLDQARGMRGARLCPARDSPSGRAIELRRDPHQRVFWVSDGRITESEATVDAVARHVWVLAQVPVDGRWLPQFVSELTTDAAGGRQCRDVVDEWTSIGGAAVPARRHVVLAPVRRRVDIVIDEHRVSSGSSAAEAPP